MEITTKLWIALAMIAIVLGVTLWQTFTLVQKLDSLGSRLDDVVEYVAPEGLATLLNAKKEGKVVFYTTMAATTIQPLVDAFNKKYPFITVEWVRGESPQLYERYVAEKEAGRSSMDILQVSDMAIVVDAKAKGYIYYYNSTAYDYYPPEYIERGYWGVNRAFVMGVAVNKQFIINKTFDSWWDILDPSYQGKVVMQDPRTSGSAFIQMYGLRNVLGTRWNEFITGLGQLNPTLETSATLGWTKLVSGDKWMDPWTASYRIVQYPTAPVNITFPEEGTFLVIFPMMIMTGSPHPNAAKIFFDWLLSEEGQEVVTSGSGYYPLRINATIDSQLPPLEDLNLKPTNWTDLISKHDAILQEILSAFGIS